MSRTDKLVHVSEIDMQQALVDVDLKFGRDDYSVRDTNKNNCRFEVDDSQTQIIGREDGTESGRSVRTRPPGINVGGHAAILHDIMHEAIAFFVG